MVDDEAVNFRGRSLIVSRVSGRSTWLALACLTMFMGFVALAGPPAAQADDTVWICKPGQSDDLCAGTIDGSTLPPPGQSSQPLGYTRPDNAPIDCFYLYPTQSDQPPPNSNLDKDPPIKRVVVQQARMFSSVCNVYAPMYRQVTNTGNQVVYNPAVETAYQSAKAGFEDYLKNYNHGRGFIMIGHSQGSAHTARLIDEMVDKDANLRKRFIGAIAPGGNIDVPIGKNVGGLYDNVPACSEIGEYKCLIAFSTFTDVPGANAPFSRLDFGYWIYPEPRPDDTKYEVVCTNPAMLDGSDGAMLPLANLDYLNGVPAGAESPSPWIGAPDYYTAECKRQDGAHWLNVTKTNLPGDTRPDLGAFAGSGTNWHVPEVNLFEGNLINIARTWSGDYTTEQNRIAGLTKKMKQLKARLKKVNKRLSMAPKTRKKLLKKIRKASGKHKRVLKRKLKKVRRQATADRKRARSLKKQIAGVTRQLG
jgi:hypothetical protein